MKGLGYGDDAVNEWLDEWSGTGGDDENDFIVNGNFDVYQENWDAVHLFDTMSTQWNFAGMNGIRTGLKYEVLPGLVQLLSIPFSETTLQQIRVLESVALQELSKQQHD